MITIAKAIIGFSALISAGVVAAQKPAETPDTAAITIAAKADRLASGEGEGCEGQVWPRITGPCLIATKADDGCATASWPYVAGNCLVDARDLNRRSLRSVTIERRIGAQSSELIRVPVQDFAQR